MADDERPGPSAPGVKLENFVATGGTWNFYPPARMYSLHSHQVMTLILVQPSILFRDSPAGHHHFLTVRSKQNVPLQPLTAHLSQTPRRATVQRGERCTIAGNGTVSTTQVPSRNTHSCTRSRDGLALQERIVSEQGHHVAQRRPRGW